MLWLWLACSEPRFGRLADAVEAYDRGRAALDAGDDAEAVEAFSLAVQRDPRSPELRLWQGRALAAAGELGAAVGAASAALDLRPGWPTAHYNRAAWALRSGDPTLLEQARADLSVALGSSEISPLDAALDPDLAPFRADPRFAGIIPPAALPAAVEGPEGAVFWGSDWVLRVRVSAPPGAVLVFAGEPGPPAALRPIRVLETIEPSGPLEIHTLELAFRVEGAGEGALGPYVVEAAGLRAELPPTPYTLLAPPDRGAPVAGRELSPFFFPSEAFAQVPEGASVTRAGRLYVRAAPGDEIVPADPNALAVELRRDDRPQWTGRVALEGADARVYRRGEPLAGH